jgi:hypothetical protein
MVKSTRGFSTECTFVFGDTHFSAPIDGVAPQFCHDSKALSVLFQIMQDRKPDRIIHNGDLLELASVSKYAAGRGELGRVKGVDGKLRDASIPKDVEMGERMWEYFARAHPAAIKHQLEGNHDIRVIDLMSRSDFSQFGHSGIRGIDWTKLGVEFKRYDCHAPWVSLGQTCVMHGHSGSGATMVNQHDNVIHGHNHQMTYTPKDKNHVQKRRAWGIGCMCNLWADFNSRGGRQNGHTHGFAVVYRDGDECQVRSVEIPLGYRVLDFDGKPYWAKPLKSLDKMLGLLEV